MVHPHLITNQALLKSYIPLNACMLDATVGNGYDTLFLADHFLGNSGSIYCLDIQKNALERSRELLNKKGIDLEKVFFFERCHSTFPEEIQPDSLDVALYNLGWLPKGDKLCTTKSSTTLKSLLAVVPLLKETGCISVMAYPGHEEGFDEKETLLNFFKSTLFEERFQILFTEYFYNPKAPCLFFLYPKTCRK